ncbi:DNA-processing protein DprA [Streptacidiphilus sp. ASG 303]|uniref:DNA-processing protein DprA n=1 Tax=Streptacidiphilus sp. ASG 303 TaxID=2896847 RepID=UPI001E3A15FD|nr:DNA-processing protein DprA [Streptacidiphilus sp. ASG 303]MCD0484973.1 DNA-processing protein DprA [Streptacidiphilus sp. ASG 303]
MPSGAADDGERLARAAITRLAEPGDPAVGQWIDDLGAAGLLRLLRTGGTPPGAAPARMARYRARAAGIDPAADLERIRAGGGRFVVPGDAEWPTQLDDLGAARPVGLWTAGAASLRLLALRSVAVVGARSCTAYGAHVAGELAAGLAERGWVVVSGAAYGIDAAAHRGALAAGGPTVSVLACGVDVAYPRGHAELIRRISRQGLLVSELPPGEHPNRFRFVLRNRVIAALTRGTVVVEAALRSGALSTARRARDLNRLTCGVPGPVTSELSSGVHALLRSGAAALVTDAAEVAELVGGIGADLADPRCGPVLPHDLLPPQARLVFDALPARVDGAPVEAVVRATGLPPDDVLQRLYELASLGFAERSGARWRARTTRGDDTAG